MKCEDCNLNIERKIITLCGSTRFKEEFELANRWLTEAGYIVLSVGCFNHADELNPPHELKEKLDDLHFDKIKISNEVLIINKDGYVGRSTDRECDFADQEMKEIYFWETCNNETWQIDEDRIHPIIKNKRG